VSDDEIIDAATRNMAPPPAVQQVVVVAANANVDANDANAKQQHRSSASSSRDDTVGHFKGQEGSIFADRYRIIREVGVGTFGRVVECLDLRKGARARSTTSSSSRQRDTTRQNNNNNNNNNNNVVAIKIVRNVKRYYESALIEADIVEDVNRRGDKGISHCAIMYDAFSFSGHYCMVFESLGPSLYDFLKRQKYQPFPLVCVRDFAKQLLETLEFLHGFRLIHTDLKPEVSNNNNYYCNCNWMWMRSIYLYLHIPFGFEFYTTHIYVSSSCACLSACLFSINSYCVYRIYCF
jgi:hypothetical protein